MTHGSLTRTAPAPNGQEILVLPAQLSEQAFSENQFCDPGNLLKVIQSQLPGLLSFRRITKNTSRSIRVRISYLYSPVSAWLRVTENPQLSFFL